MHSYAFAELLVSSLYQQYEQEKAKDRQEPLEGSGNGGHTHAQAFIEKYMQLLEAGGTEHHEVALKQRFGDAFDLTDPTFWEGGLKEIGGMVEEYETLAQKIRGKASPPSTVIPMDSGHREASTVTSPNRGVA